MKNINIIFLPVFILYIFSLQAAAGELTSESELKAEAINIVKTFSGILKPKLKGAIQTGGLEHAINICSIEAPKIAKNLSEETGWSVKRVSLKPRNKSSAVPDAFERKILEQFNELQIKGEPSSIIEHSKIVDKKFRYMKAQAIEGICLNCHGNSIHPDAKKMINKHYPEDVATGYSLGQIRGAFSLVKDL
jgi:Protein of unknown function (DUF3365)